MVIFILRHPQDENSRRIAGLLGEVMVDDKGQTDFRLLNHSIRVPDIIGRSFVVQTNDSQ